MPLHGGVEAEIDVVGEGPRDAQHVGDRRGRRHDRIVVAVLETLVDLVERVADLVRRRPQERAGHVRCCWFAAVS